MKEKYYGINYTFGFGGGYQVVKAKNWRKASKQVSQEMKKVLNIKVHVTEIHELDKVPEDAVIK